ncbi:mitochondrial carrier [Guyanagaster necrorhizus]|uniref:Mitochondrial carrier n=1 Tax=Guyanagaster necrorhizus TaxID=856835 RepID=A0A9P7VMH5_9AGAR|nr:mitochondrial carrier [Guyanagaster necrorhizus MCA 3950]KAG7443923.1 mitochondrial carrier [Guyanagaster necrorhizus MCA 3950]
MNGYVKANCNEGELRGVRIGTANHPRSGSDRITTISSCYHEQRYSFALLLLPLCDILSIILVELNPLLDFLAGTIGGIAGLVVGYPFDTVKVRFQNPEMTGKYRSTMHALTTIIKEERFIGMYKGITSPLATAALMNGLVFASYRFFMKIQLENNSSIPTLTQIALAGAGSGIVSSIVTTPTELIKIRQQSLLVPSSTYDVVLDILRKNGIRGLYRGIAATALRDLGYGSYFFAYEATSRYFTPTPGSSLHPSEIQLLLSQVDGQVRTPSWIAMLLAGGVAGIAGWVTTFPLDVVKTRMQSTESSYRSSILGPDTRSSPSSPLLLPGSNRYRTVWSTIVASYEAEGLAVFFRGLAPTLVRAVPVNMATFATFEAITHGFSQA